MKWLTRRIHHRTDALKSERCAPALATCGALADGCGARTPVDMCGFQVAGHVFATRIIDIGWPVDGFIPPGGIAGVPVIGASATP